MSSVSGQRQMLLKPALACWLTDSVQFGILTEVNENGSGILLLLHSVSTSTIGTILKEHTADYWVSVMLDFIKTKQKSTIGMTKANNAQSANLKLKVSIHLHSEYFSLKKGWM